MLSIITRTFSPLFGLFLFVLGSALFGTLIGIRLTHDGYGPGLIGAMSFAMNFGYLIGAFKAEFFILRVGHIRAFAAFSSALAAVCILQGLLNSVWFWFLLRFVSGIGISGLFIVIESWLLVEGTNKTRGQVLALYMITLYAGQAFGQLLLKLGSIEDLSLFAISAMLCSLAVIPLAMTKAPSPQFHEPSKLKIRKMISLSPVGIIGCVGAGMILGSIYSLMPVYIIQELGSNDWVAYFMAIIILGGMMLQFPVGKLSDMISRKKVLIMLSLGTVVISLINIVSFGVDTLAYTSCFLLGGITFTIYPVSISHASESLDFKDMIAGTQVLLLAYSVGAMTGPLVAPLFMSIMGSDGLFVYFAVIAILMSASFMYTQEVPVVNAHEEYFVPIVQTTPLSAELDPRTDEPVLPPEEKDIENLPV